METYNNNNDNDNDKLPKVEVRVNAESGVYVAIVYSSESSFYSQTDCAYCLGYGKSGGCVCGADSDPD